MQILLGEDVSRYGPPVPTRAIDVAWLTKDEAKYRSPKIIIVKTGRGIVATLDSEGQRTLQSIYNVTFAEEGELSPKYILGIVNSSLMRKYIKKEVTSYKKLFPQLNQRHIQELPIRRIDFSNPEEVAMHDRLVALVERMLALHRRLAAKGPVLSAAKEPVHDEERAELERHIAQMDREIDALVYDLYGLTEEERQVVEESDKAG